MRSFFVIIALILVCFFISCESRLFDGKSTEYHEAQKYRASARANYKLMLIQCRRYNYKECFTYAKNTQLILEAIDFQNDSMYYRSSAIIGNLYYKFADYEKSKEELLKWFKYEDAVTSESPDYLNTLGLLSHYFNDLDSSSYFFEKALQAADETEQNVWTGIIKGNYSRILLAQGEEERGLAYLNEDLTISRKEGVLESTLLTLLLISSYHAEKNDWNYFLNAEEEILKTSLEMGHGMFPNYYLLKSRYFDYINNSNKSLEAFKLYQHAKDSMQRVLENSNFDMLNFQALESVSTQQIERLENEKLNSYRARNITYITFFFIILGILILVIIKVIDYQKTMDKFRTKKNLIEQELQNTEQEMSSYVQALEQKSMQIESLNEGIQEVSEKYSSLRSKFGKSHVNQELTEIKILTEENWLEFKSVFSVAYPNFLDNLIGSTGKLSYGELRLACMIRLNLTNNQMAEMTGVSPGAVKQSLLRLKKKLKFETQAELTNFIFSLPS